MTIDQFTSSFLTHPKTWSSSADLISAVEAEGRDGGGAVPEVDGVRKGRMERRYD